MSIPSRREARRARDKDDFIRATQAAVPAKHREEAGRNAGPTYREHLENKLANAVSSWENETNDNSRNIKRGVIRGLAIALLLYEDSYSMNDKAKLLKIERSFMQ